MTKLEQTLLAIKEENLSKEQLDVLYSNLAQLRADVRMETSQLLKAKAMFLAGNPEKSVAQRKIEWDSSENGQRLLELKMYILVLGDSMEGVKTRIYSLL